MTGLVILLNEAPALDADIKPVAANAFSKCITYSISREQYQLLVEKYPISWDWFTQRLLLILKSIYSLGCPFPLANFRRGRMNLKRLSITIVKLWSQMYSAPVWMIISIKPWLLVQSMNSTT
jgi:hypothetical protein